MSLRPGRRVAVLAAAGVLVVLGLWAVVDDPKISTGYVEVQCRSVAAGSDPVAPIPEGQDLDLFSDTAVIALGDGDLVHEDSGALDPPGAPSLTALDDPEASDADDVIAAIRDDAERCDAERTHRVFLAGISFLPATVLLAIGVLAQHDGRPRPPRRKLITVDPAFRS